MKKIKDALINPATEFRPWAIWLWNGRITESEAISQLTSFAEKGFGGLAIRSSRNIVPAYLSEEFFKIFEAVLSHAKALGIGIRLADDFALPLSGFYNSIAQSNSSLRACQMVLEHAEIILDKASFEREITDAGTAYVIAARIKSDRIVANSIKILESSKKAGLYSWKALGGDWQVMVFRRKYIVEPDGHSVANVFNVQAAQAYIHEILDKFKARFSKYMPRPFEGLVTETPAYLPADNAIPWDDDLVVRYSIKFKKDLVRILPALFFEVEDAFARERANFYSLMTQLMYERFCSVLEAWAKKNRLSQWVLAPERNINSANNALRDCCALTAATLSAVGAQNIDGTEESYVAARTVADTNATEFRRETISVIGRNRLCAGSTLQSLKTEIDLHALCGQSRVLLDGCFFNLDHRNHVRSPHNPSWYYPGWDLTRELCDYSSRLNQILHSVHLERPAAIIFPRSSIFADYIPGNSENARKGLGMVEKAMAELQRLNIDFDIITEEMFCSCTVRANGEFSTADRGRKGRYLVAIVPYSRLISKSVLIHLEKIAAKKGVVIFLGEAPQGSLEEGVSASFAQRIEKLIRMRKETVHVVAPKEIAPLLRHIDTTVKVSISGKRCPDIYASHGAGTGCDVYLLHNMADRRDFFATVQFPAARHFYLADCQNGDMHELKDVEREGKTCSVGLAFAQRTTYMVIATSSAVALPGTHKPKNYAALKFATQPRNYRIVLKDQWAFTPDSLNILPVANWNIRIGLSRESGGYSHFCESYFEAREIPDVCLLLQCGIDAAMVKNESMGKTYEVAINGNAIEPGKSGSAGSPADAAPPQWETYCGRQTLKYDLKSHIVKGFNRISIRTVNTAGDPETLIYPPLIAGSFSILRGARGWIIDKPSSIAGYDSWTKYGFPYLSGSGTYRQDFELPSGYKRIVLKFTQTSGPVSVKLNQKDLGEFAWHPMEIDITAICEQRRNSLEVRVLNTMDNVLRMNGRPSGLIGEVYLDVY